MARREPTLSAFDTASAVEPGEVPRRRETKRSRSSARVWVEALFLWGLLVALAFAANMHFGWVSFSPTPGLGERTLPGLLAVSGLLAIYAVQFMAFAVLLFRNALRAFLALLIPGYFFLALRREGGYFAFAALFLLGVAVLAAGVIMSS